MATEVTASRAQVPTRTSTNWCGYMVTGAPGSFQSASANWQVPQVLAGPNPDSYYTLGTIWVGLNGCTAESFCLTQAGCDVNAYKASGEPEVPEYPSWYELELRGDTGDTKLGDNYPVAAMDELHCAITHDTGLRFVIELANRTQNWTYQQAHTYPDGSPPPLMDSAEFVVEAPIFTGNTIGKLTNFGTVTFREATVNGRPLTDFTEQAVGMSMVNTSTEPATGANLLAKPGAFGNNFTVDWRNFGSRRQGDARPFSDSPTS